MKLLDGKTLSAQFIEEIQEMALNLDGIPHLTVVQVGDDPASNSYIRHKERACKKIKFNFTHRKLPIETTTEQLLCVIDQLNRDNTVNGFIVQLPLPDHIDLTKITLAIDPMKDVDCFHPENVGLMAKGNPRYYPATPYGVIKLLRRYEIPIKGKWVTIVGKSDIVGKPLQLMLSNEFKYAATTISCDRYTENLKELTSIADILIVAAGVPNLIKDESWIKKGAVVVDVGINRIGTTKEGKAVLRGDVNFDRVKEHCSYITPVPGGVGPMTVATLIYNVMYSLQLTYGNSYHYKSAY